MPHANEMSIEDFLALPDVLPPGSGDVASIVILPNDREELHYSGYRGMYFVPCNNAGEPICKLSGWSDALHLDGIGGMGHRWYERFGHCPKLVVPTGWSIDCLAVSRLCRLFPSRDMCDGIIVETWLASSFEIFGRIRPERDPRLSNAREQATLVH